MPATKTTWEDLANIGWSKNDVYLKANAQRGGTMEGVDDLSLNSGAAADWQWWSYNEIKGDPILRSRIPQDITLSSVVWNYDNRKNSEPFADKWSEAWSESTSAELGVTNQLAFSVTASVSIASVGETGMSLSFSTSTSETVRKENTHNLSHEWELNVGPYEKLSLVREITTQTTVEEYSQVYGLTSGSLCGTKGKKWNDHYYWAYDLNGILGSPTGEFLLKGMGKIVHYNFYLERESATGKTREQVNLPSPLKSLLRTSGEPEKTIALEIAGPGELVE